MAYFPSVIERTGRGTKSYDLPTKLLESRIVLLSGAIDEILADSIIMQLLWLSADDGEKDIDMYIKSPGGSVAQGLAIHDVMNRLPCKVNTIAMGEVASMGSYLLAAGTGTRSALPNSRIMIHSVISGLEGSFPDMKVTYEEIQHTQDKVIKLLAGMTKGKTSLEEMQSLCDRDYYMDPERAVELGIIDVVNTKR